MRRMIVGALLVGFSVTACDKFSKKFDSITDKADQLQSKTDQATSKSDGLTAKANGVSDKTDAAKKALKTQDSGK